MIELSDATASAPNARMPGLETLAARGDTTAVPAATCDLGLIARFGFDAAAGGANAAIYACAEGLNAGTGYWLRADPVSLAATMAHLTLSELPDNALTRAEAQALSASLTDQLALDDYVLFTPHPQRWYVRSDRPLDLATLPPSACAGTLQESDLPAGRDGPQWKRMMTEAQMLLHAHPVNEAREAAGKAPANGIWPWGGGALLASVEPARYGRVFCDDLLTRGLARAAGVSTRALPADPHTVWAEEPCGSAALVVQRLRTAGGMCDFAALDRQWSGALRTALAAGRLTALSIFAWGARDPVARRVEQRHLGRWWRRKRALDAHG